MAKSTGQFGRSAMRKIRYEQVQAIKEKKDTGLLKLEPVSARKVVTEERLYNILDDLEKYYELWLSYPDKLLDLLLPIDTTFKLHPYQKFLLRINFRFQQTSFTATRGASKSFMSILTKILKGILLPGIKESIVAEHKNQAVAIAKEKTQELFSLMPLLKQEIDFKRGSGTTVSDDMIRYNYLNGSQLDVTFPGSTARGGRRHGLLAEEVQLLPETEFNEITLPLLNISRRMKTGELNPNERHQQVNYVGTAYFTNSFGHDKTIEVLINSILHPSSAFCWGMDYRIPLYYGLLNENFINQIKDSSTFSESSFSREYMSKWSSTAEGSLFNFEKLQGLRKIKRAEWSSKAKDKEFYILAVDVARTSARTVAEVLKVRIGEDRFHVGVVNIFLLEGRNFLHQAAKIKEWHGAFNFRTVVVDTNGLIETSPYVARAA